MEATREVIAENIAELRKSAKLTQAELAEKLNYSDKAISKWERGDSIPDVLVLAELAELFSVTVDYFLHPHGSEEKKPVMEIDKKRLRLAICLTSSVAPYAIAVLLYFVFREIFLKPDWLWKLFIFPLPVVAVVALVFVCVWSRKRIHILISVSALLWSLILVAFVLVKEFTDAWFLFILGAPLQAIILFWLLVGKNKK